MKVSFKKVNPNIETHLPKYATDGSAGLDIYATSKYYDEFGCVCYGTNLAGKIPNGYVGLLFPRSSNSKKDLLLSNAVGVWDSDYTGEILFKFKPSLAFCQHGISSISDNYEWIGEADEHFDYNIGDRIGQLIIIPYPDIEPEWVDELPETIRGNKGWGSTGN